MKRAFFIVLIMVPFYGSVFMSDATFAAANQYGIDLGEAMQGAANIRMLRSISRAEDEDAKYTAAKRRQLEQTQGNSAQHDYDEWFAAAAPRMSRFKDFKSVVFRDDLSISADMMRLMAGSRYAADLAYYFGKHGDESATVSRMRLLDAAKYIIRLEVDLDGDVK